MNMICGVVYDFIYCRHCGSWGIPLLLLLFDSCGFVLNNGHFLSCYSYHREYMQTNVVFNFFNSLSKSVVSLLLSLNSHKQSEQKMSFKRFHEHEHEQALGRGDKPSCYGLSIFNPGLPSVTTWTHTTPSVSFHPFTAYIIHSQDDTRRHMLPFVSLPSVAAVFLQMFNRSISHPDS